MADLTAAADLTPTSRVLEIGCGTGQLTVPLAMRGCAITALDLSLSMVDLARRNLAAYPATTVELSAFETWPLPPVPFDLVVSATAFHWIDPATRTAKAAEALRPGGTLALITTHHVAGGTEDFWVEVQHSYRRHDPDTPPDLRLPRPDSIPPDATDFTPHFAPIHFRRYERDVPYTGDEYVDLLLTYSNHRSLPEPNREALLTEIKSLIDTRYAGRIVKRYLFELAFARLRHEG